MVRKLRKQEVLDTIVDALNDCGIDGPEEQHTASYVLAALEDEGIIDDREVDL